MFNKIKSMLTINRDLKISRQDYEAMLAAVLKAFPFEGCGLLAGDAGLVQQVYSITNTLNSPAAYRMDPQQQVESMLDLEERGLELLAIYHSHPNGPEMPSFTDISQAYYPEAATIIISLSDVNNPVVRAFSILDGQVTKLQLNVI